MSAEASAPAAENAVAALRGLAHAVAHLHDFDRFVAALQGAVERSAPFGRATLRIGRSAGGDEAGFAPGLLTAPLVGGSGRFGTLQVAPDAGRRAFGAGDLHLLAGLAEAVSALLDQSLRLQEAGRTRELLRFLLDQAPVGIAAYTAERRLLVANGLAARWLGAATPPFDEIAAGRGDFYLRIDGKLICGEARPSPGGGWAVALHDLTPEQVRMIDALQRETYRALAGGHPLAFALVESASVRDGVLSRLPTLRTALAASGVAGPYDAHRIGLVLPGVAGIDLRARLRGWQSLLAGGDRLRLGCAELGRDGRTPEALLEVAVQRTGPYSEAVRPAVLAHDDDTAVNGAIALVLGRELRLVTSTDLERTRELLRRDAFDVLVTEIDLRGGDGVALARFAREAQPGLRPVFTTVRPPPYAMPADLAAGGAVVLRKPFAPDAVARAVAAALLPEWSADTCVPAVSVPPGENEPASVGASTPNGETL